MRAAVHRISQILEPPIPASSASTGSLTRRTPPGRMPPSTSPARPNFIQALPTQGRLMVRRHGHGAESLEPIRKLRGVLRRGILVVAKAARRAHPRGGLQRPSQRRPPAKDPPPGGFSRKRPARFVARRSQTPAGMLPPHACIPRKLEREGGSPSDRFRENRTPLRL